MSSTIAQDFNNYYCQFLSAQSGWEVGLWLDACVRHGEVLGMSAEDILKLMQDTCDNAGGPICELTD